GQLAGISAETTEALNNILPAAWSHGNPVDTLGDAAPDTYVRALEIVAADPGCDAVLSILAPQGMSEPEKSAALFSKAAESIKKPLIASWMGGSRMQLAANVLNDARIPTFKYPDDAARSFAYMWRYTLNLRALYEAAMFTGDLPVDGPKRVNKILSSALAAGRNVLTEYESKQVLAVYGLPVTTSILAATQQEALSVAERIGYPVVLKLNSETVTHKSDRGGVKLNLQDAEAVRSAFEDIERIFAPEGAFQGVTIQPMIKKSGFELIIGSSSDPQF